MSAVEPEAGLEYIDPLNDPSGYGGEELLADLQNVSQLEGEGPDVSPELAEALQESDYAAAESHLSPIRDWFSKDRYEVLQSGVHWADVPVLVAAAAEVTDLELVASQETSRSAGGEVALKIGGSGIGTSGKLTVSESLKLTCSAGEQLAASVSVPVYWERRARLHNEDENWFHTEIDRGHSSLPIRFKKLDGFMEARALRTQLVDTSAGGIAAAEVSKSFTHEVGADFNFGLRIAAIGLDTSLKVTAAAAMTTTLEASLPFGHQYQVAWLGGPWGVRVSTLS